MDRSFYFILFYFISFYFYFISYSFFFSILFHKRISSCPFSARAIFFSSRRIKIVIDFFFSFSLFKKPPKIEKKIKNRKKGNIFFFVYKFISNVVFFLIFWFCFHHFPFSFWCFLFFNYKKWKRGRRPGDQKVVPIPDGKPLVSVVLDLKLLGIG